MSKTLAGHTIRFYQELEKRAKKDENGYPVFEGHTTKVFAHLGISTSWHSQIMRILQDSQSIEVIRRGTANGPSVLVLWDEPSEERIYEFDLTRPDNLATMVERLERRVNALESGRLRESGLDIPQAMANHESRISQLESFKQERETNAKAESKTAKNRNQNGNQT